MYPERCHAGIAGGLEINAGIDFSYSFHIFRYLCSSAILNQRKVKMRQHNLRILFFLLVLWGEMCIRDRVLPVLRTDPVLSFIPNVARMLPFFVACVRETV